MELRDVRYKKNPKSRGCWRWSGIGETKDVIKRVSSRSNKGSKRLFTVPGKEITDCYTSDQHSDELSMRKIVQSVKNISYRQK